MTKGPAGKGGVNISGPEVHLIFPQGLRPGTEGSESRWNQPCFFGHWFFEKYVQNIQDRFRGTIVNGKMHLLAFYFHGNGNIATLPFRTRRVRFFRFWADGIVCGVPREAERSGWSGGPPVRKRGEKGGSKTERLCRSPPEKKCSSKRGWKKR